MTEKDEPKQQGRSQPHISLIRSPLLKGKAQYLGGAPAGPSNKIFFVPGNATNILVLDPSTDQVYHIGPALPGPYKWLRAQPAANGILYGLPCHSDFVLKIDPFTEEVTLLPIPPIHEDEAVDTVWKNEEEPILGVPWKYHGGNLCPIDQCIYTVPQYATRVLKIDPATDKVSHVGPRLDGRYKWYGGLVGCDGAIYGLPQNADSVLRIDPSQEQIVTLHGLSQSTDDIDSTTDDIDNKPTTSISHSLGQGGHKWHGGAAMSDGTAIFGIPCHSNHILRIDPPQRGSSNSLSTDNHECAGVGVSVCLLGGPQVVRAGRHRSDGRYKFLGAVVDDERRCVYFVPSGAERVLRVDVRTNEVKEVGPNLRDLGLERVFQNKWQNGFTSKLDGCLYGIPLNGDKVLRIDPSICVSTHSNDTHHSWSDPIVETVGDAHKGCEKWEGCVVGTNGVAYCVPNDYKGLLKIVPVTVTIDDNDGNNTDNLLEPQPETSADNGDADGDAKEESMYLTNNSQVKETNVDIEDNAEEPTRYHTNGKEDNDKKELVYKFGIPTLRSATHRVRYSSKKGQGREKDKPKVLMGNKEIVMTGSCLPATIRQEHVISYNTESIDLHGALVKLLSRGDENDKLRLLGGWPYSNNNNDGDEDKKENDDQHEMERRMEHFRIPPQSLSRSDFGGQCTEAQEALSQCIATDPHFLDTFDRLVMDVVLPWLKAHLLECADNNDGDPAPTTFYYQRPPTLRLQPGPSAATVKPHSDSVYGHQDGELNFWIPLMDNELTGTYLWAESLPGKGDFHPLKVQYGEMASFHGTHCRHYVPANASTYTRASLDFRVGIGGMFDPTWQMLGTKADHSRRQVQI